MNRNWSLSYNKKFDSLVRLAKAISDHFCRRSTGFFSAGTSRLFVGVDRNQPVTMRNASLMDLSVEKKSDCDSTTQDHSIQQLSEQLVNVVVRMIF